MTDHDNATTEAADLLRRAAAAYFRSGKAGLTIAPTPVHSRVTDHDGKRYVVLANRQHVVAVYRVRTDGVLKGLRRWPAAVEQRSS